MKKERLFKKISNIHEECPVCEMERDLIYGETRDILKVRGLDIEVVSKIHYCPKGGHYFYSIDDEEEKFQFAYRKFKKAKGFLQSEEIKAIRQQYGLSQKNFARLLNWGDITIQRYESGAIQDDAHNDVLMLIKDFDNFKKYFAGKKDFINPDIAKKIKERIDAIEKRRSMDIMAGILSIKKKAYSMPIQSNMELHYLSEIGQLQSCPNDNELALAA
jgi:putative zinc finger/helix-turn-helix YgiT family protein